MVRVDFEKKDKILNQVENLLELLLKMKDKDQDSICYWIYQNRGWRHEKDYANDPEAQMEDGGSKGRCDEKTERERDRGSKIFGKKDKEALTLDGGEDPRWKEEDDLHQKEGIRRDKHKDDRANKIYTCEKFLIEDTDPKENFELNTNLSQNLKTYVSSTLNAKNWWWEA